jgi:hypothetical protein
MIDPIGWFITFKVPWGCVCIAVCVAKRYATCSATCNATCIACGIACGIATCYSGTKLVELEIKLG